MNHQLTVSVIIPAYNSSSTIARALNSVINQTVAVDEIIVIDDGSEDNTCKIVETHYPFVTLIRQKNSGAASARNAGVKSAKSELIAFLDSDDFWHIKKNEYQISIFSQYPNLGICSTQLEYFYEKNGISSELEARRQIGPCCQKLVFFKDVFQRPFLATPSVMIKTSLFRKINGFNENLETAEDVDLWIRSTYVSEYRLILNPLTFVVKQTESLSTRASISPFESHLNVINSFIKGKSFSLKFKYKTLKKTQSFINCNWGSSLLYYGCFEESLKKLLKSFLQYPNQRASYLLSKAIFKIFLKKTRSFLLKISVK